MAAEFLRAFDLASSDVRQQIIIGIAERLSGDEVQCSQNALQSLERRFDILCGVSRASGAKLPHEIQLQIVDLLDITDIYYCINVCRKWRCLLLECKQLSDDLLRKWFPALFDEGGIKFTCGFLKESDRIFPVDRVEGLQRGRRFRDLTCPASLRIPAQISTLAQTGALHQAGSSSNSTPASSIGSRDIWGHAVSKYLYADGRLAWQLTPAPGEWANSIIVHDFRANTRWNLSLPSMRTRGIKLVLWALGRDLVVARVVGERVLYAWDLVSRVVDRVTLQNPPIRCFTRYRYVVIVTHSGELLLWSFGHGLANVDVDMPQDKRDYRGPAKPKEIPRAPLSAFEIQNSRVMFHPRDEDVFFLATFDDRNQPDEFLLLWVYEFRNKRCCRIFTCSIPPERHLWTVFGAQKVNAHGTYQLLEGLTSSRDVRFSGVTFNTISKSFGTLQFQTPDNTDFDVSLVWNDHLALTYYSPKASSIRNLVILGRLPYSDNLEEVSDAEDETQTLERVIEHMVTFISLPEVTDNDVVPPRRLQTAIEALEQGKSKYDITRPPDVSLAVPDVGAAICLRYVLSFFGGQCDKEGHHVRECPRASGLPPPKKDSSPIKYLDHSILRDGVDIKAVSILGDDDFLVVVSNRNCYTVFAVDEDGKIAEAVLDATESVQEAPRESSKDTGS